MKFGYSINGRLLNEYLLYCFALLVSNYTAPYHYKPPIKHNSNNTWLEPLLKSNNQNVSNHLKLCKNLPFLKVQHFLYSKHISLTVLTYFVWLYPENQIKNQPILANTVLLQPKTNNKIWYFLYKFFFFRFTI